MGNGTDLTYTVELARQLFFLVSAGLGALFAALYPLTRAVVAGTYDENEDQSYITRIVVGLISGTILGQLIELDSLGGLGGLTKPTVALIGGFSASLVFTILTRLVQGLESVFTQGAPPDSGSDAAVMQTATAQAEAKVMEERLAIARELTRLRAAVLPQAAAVANDFDDLIRRVLRGDLGS